MRKARTNRNGPAKLEAPDHHDSIRLGAALDHAVVLIDTVCCLAGDEHLIGNQSNPDIKQLRRAIGSPPGAATLLVRLSDV